MQSHRSLEGVTLFRLVRYSVDLAESYANSSSMPRGVTFDYPAEARSPPPPPPLRSTAAPGPSSARFTLVDPDLRHVPMDCVTG